MNPPDATYKNGRYELPPAARGVLFLAEPPEAGWRIQEPLAEDQAVGPNMQALPGELKPHRNSA